MPETQEVSMEDYAKARSAGETPVLPAATTLTEKVETAPESAPGSPESEEEKKAKGGGWQRRIDKLTKRGTELEETLKEEREARQRLEAKLAGRDPAELTKKPVEQGPRPKPKDIDLKADGTAKYADYSEFVEDLSDWKTEQALLKLKNEQREEGQKAELEKQGRTFQESFAKRGNEYFEQHPDDRELLLGEDSPAKNIPAGSVMDVVILESDHGFNIIAHLCKNPDEIPRILALGPVAQAREMMKIERTFDSTEEKPSPEPVKPRLPAPIRPVSTSTSRSTAKPESMSMEDYANWRKTAR